MYLLIVLSNALYLVFCVNMINDYVACIFVTTRDLLNDVYFTQEINFIWNDDSSR